MSFFSKLFGSTNSSDKFDEQTLIDANICPNCWGKQEYADQYRKYEKDQAKSTINKDKTQQKAFVQNFVETHLTGIQLRKDGKNLTCPKCSTKFSVK